MQVSELELTLWTIPFDIIATLFYISPMTLNYSIQREVNESTPNYTLENTYMKMHKIPDFIYRSRHLSNIPWPYSLPSA